MINNEPYVNPEAQPWAREVNNSIDGVQNEVRRVEQNLSSTQAALSDNYSVLAITVRNLVSGNYTKPEIDAKIADVTNQMNIADNNLQASKANVSHTHDQSQVLGTWSKDVNNTGSVAANDVYARSLATNITAARVALWGRTSDGYIATASSSERYKDHIREVDIDPLAVLSIVPVYYSWIAEVAERDRRAALPTDHPEYTPDMHVATEVGFIAERMHEAGLWQFVVYEREDDGSLRRVNGEPVPEGIHYINWGIALQVAVRYQQERINGLEDRLQALENRISAVE